MKRGRRPCWPPADSRTLPVLCSWAISQNYGGADETCGVKTSAPSFQIVTRMTKIMKSEIPAVSAIVDPENLSSIGMNSKWAVAVLVGLTFAACYFRSFVFPNIPVLLWGDQLGAATD